MARRPDSEYGFTFTNVEIFRDQELGHGSYGAVYKAKCDSLPCAAKLIYPVLFASNVPQQAAPPQGKEHRQPMRRFEAECRFLSQIKHPNIVQYLGVYREPETNVPVLLMELMDESLTHFLESSQNPVLYHIQVNILHDTILALAFLHSNGITHREMSSNNVLLIAGSRAKVTDFGMSTLTDAAASHLASMTQCPGTPAYMSPEALDEPPVYSEKLDCFSFGILMIQVITREFPKPKDRFQTMELAHPTQPSRRYQARVLVPELERRQSHISLIPATHPLRPIALDCIKDRDTGRPTAEQLCETLEQCNSTPLYASSVQQVRDRKLQLRTQRQTIEMKEQQLQEQRVIIQDKDRQLQDNDRQIQVKDRQIQDKDRQLQELIQDKDRQIQDKDQQIQDKDWQIQVKDKQLQDNDQLQQQENQQLRKMLEVKNQQITELQRGTPQRGQTPRRHAQDLQPQLQQLQLSHISLIPAIHPLRPIALDCIKDRDAQRPTAEQLCETLEQFKSTPLYASSVQPVRDRELQLTTQRQTIETNKQQLQHQRVIILDKDRQLQDKDRQIRDRDQQIQDKDQHQQEQQQENQQLRKMLEVKNQQITELQRGTPQRGQTPRRHAQDLQPQLQQLQLSEDQQTEVKKKPASKELTLKWRKGPKAPAAMERGSSTIIGETVYVNPSNRRNVYAFHCNTTQWSILPLCPYTHSTLTTINSMLTAVGGIDTTSFWYNSPTNKVITHRDHKWVELYPPMPTERYWAAVLSTTTHVAVMGGWTKRGWILNIPLAITEVMDIRTKQWSTASPFPYGISQATTTLCGEILYLMGGYFDSNQYSVLSCRFSDLVQSMQSTRPSTQKQPSSSTVATHSKVWHNIPDLPVRYSTCVTVQGKVLAIGGIDKQCRRTTSIYELNTDNNEWSHKSDMNVARKECLATALPDKNILVLGGFTTGFTGTDETEIATTC